MSEMKPNFDENLDYFKSCVIQFLLTLMCQKWKIHMSCASIKRKNTPSFKFTSANNGMNCIFDNSKTESGIR